MVKEVRMKLTKTESCVRIFSNIESPCWWTFFCKWMQLKTRIWLMMNLFGIENFKNTINWKLKVFKKFDDHPVKSPDFRKERFYHDVFEKNGILEPKACEKSLFECNGRSWSFLLSSFEINSSRLLSSFFFSQPVLSSFKSTEVVCRNFWNWNHWQFYVAFLDKTRPRTKKTRWGANNRLRLEKPKKWSNIRYISESSAPRKTLDVFLYERCFRYALINLIKVFTL